ncbi:aldo/keto reductase [Butyricicoccus sp.]|uniref:aldo/keto reductase n=1 Tax=Butyricicoccus sp. TaxID=2049021 RepID=UPI003AAFC835
MIYLANEHRYDDMLYRRCGASGLKLPAISLGTWHNFGDVNVRDNAKQMLFTAFDHGITHFDSANNYGPSAGSAEEFLGDMLHNELHAYRDELIISTKAGYYMWPGPYGEWGSKKNLLASLDQSLKRLKLDYVDIFYHHRPDPDTPLEESMEALAYAVKSGKALYVGVSNYNGEELKRACAILKSMGVRMLINQPRYSMLNRCFEDDTQQAVLDEKIGSICFCPLAEGLLTDKYFKGIPADSRAASLSVFLSKETAQGMYVDVARKLNVIAQERGQPLAQMALAWNLHNPAMTSVCIGASRPQQILDNLGALKNLEFSDEELTRINGLLRDVPPFR